LIEASGEWGKGKWQMADGKCGGRADREILRGERGRNQESRDKPHTRSLPEWI